MPDEYHVVFGYASSDDREAWRKAREIHQHVAEDFAVSLVSVEKRSTMFHEVDEPGTDASADDLPF